VKRSSSPLLLVLPFARPEGGELDEWLGSSLSRGVGRRLEAAGRRVVPADAASRVCKTLGIPVPEGAVSEPDLEALLAQTGAGYLVHGSFERGGRLGLTLQVTTPDGTSEALEADGPEQSFQDVLDDAAGRLLLVVPGGPVGEVARASMESTHTTRSLDAYLALVRARLAWARGDVQTFEDEIAAACRLDPLYVEPHEVVAGAARALGDAERVVAALREMARIHGEQGREHEQATALLSVGHALVEGGAWDEGIGAYEEASRLFEGLGEVRGAAQASMNIANVHLRRGGHEQAIAEYTAGLELVRDYPEDRAKHVFNLGLALKETGDREGAVARLEEARELGVELRDDELIASAYNALGTVYDDLGEPEKALRHFRRAEEHLDPQADPMLLAGVKDHIGIILKKQGRLEEALEYSEQACQLFESRGDPLHLAIAYVNRAGLLLDLAREDEALPFIVAAHREFVRLGSPSTETTARMLRELGLDDETIERIPNETALGGRPGAPGTPGEEDEDDEDEDDEDFDDLDGELLETEDDEDLFEDDDEGESDEDDGLDELEYLDDEFDEEDSDEEDGLETA